MDVVTDALPFAPSFVAGDVLPADGRLMASAPDLLEALERLMFEVDGLIDGNDPDAEDDEWDDARELSDLARAAIRKARGEA